MKLFISYLVVSFIAIVVVMFGGLFDVSFGFFGWILYFIVVTPATAAGAVVGKLFLDAARPSAYFTRGFWDSIIKKVFWSVGPQFIAGCGVWVICSGWMIQLLE